MLNKLQAILDNECFMPKTNPTSLAIKQKHSLACDGKTKKEWTQELKITELNGDEIFISFDREGHKTYSPYLIGNEDTITAKACDYIMLKKENQQWSILLGELKMGTGSFSGESVKKQTNGSLAFLHYVMQILHHQFSCSELADATISRVVVYRKKAIKSKETNQNRPRGRAVKRTISALSSDPEFDTCSPPHEDIVKIGLPFNDCSKKTLSLTLNQFMGRSR